MESSVHREVQALFGGGTVETCHGDMVRRHFPTLRDFPSFYRKQGKTCDLRRRTRINCPGEDGKTAGF